MGALESSFESLPCALACRRIDFDLVEVREAAEGSRLLLVSGIKPWADLRVTLEPMAYREMPDFWVIEVVGPGGVWATCPCGLLRGPTAGKLPRSQGNRDRRCDEIRAKSVERRRV